MPLHTVYLNYFYNFIFIYRSNVCIETQSTGAEDENNTTETSSEIELLEEVPKHIQATISFSSCYESYDKYECITK